MAYDTIKAIQYEEGLQFMERKTYTVIGGLYVIAPATTCSKTEK